LAIGEFDAGGLKRADDLAGGIVTAAEVAALRLEALDRGYRSADPAASYSYDRPPPPA
jgi:hypothetical protein